MNEFKTHLDAYVEGVQAKFDEYMSNTFPTLRRVVISTMPGKRYVRIVEDNGSQRSVHSFVDTTNGDVLKSATWKAPAKHARGNIYSPNRGLEALNPARPSVRYLS